MGATGRALHIQAEGGVMRARSLQNERSALALDLLQPGGDALYNLETVASMAGVSRRRVLIYCRLGFVQPLFQPPYGSMVFREEALYALRRVESARLAHGIEVTRLASMLAWLDEVGHLRATTRRDWRDRPL